MFDAASDPEFAEWLVDVPEPDWSEHPVYAGMLSDAERLAGLLAVAPAVRRTGELARLDPRGLSAGQQVDLLAGLEEQRNWIESVQARVLAEIENADSTKQGLGQEVVSLVLKVPLRAAQARLKTARSLLRELPTTLGLLERGQISGRHAEVIAEASWRLDPDVVGEFETRVCARADSQTVPQLKQSIRRAELAIDPVTGEQRHQRALADRKVGFQPVDDGMVQLPVLLGAVEGQLIYTRLTAAATLLPAHDPRTMDQKRADLLVDAVLSGLPQDALPDMQGRKPSIQVVVSADTLLCLDDQPGHLTGYGPITAETARRLAADQSGTWRRLLTDPNTGQLLDISQDRYRPSQRLRDFVNARDDVCCFPTCHQPGYRCHYEHITPYLQGGATCRCNGALACRRHNNCKIDNDWDYTRNPDGSFTWTTDTEHGYLSHPPERWTQPGHEPGREPPRTITLEEIHTNEDTAYAALQKRWQQELHRAQETNDEARITNAHNAITTAQNQRARQLAHRADLTKPPF
ncbi:MAG: HNH endonuclease [Actinomycetota bacterium]|nr:HNH endonuclease [Actinomycetota bacterium]